MVGTRRMPRLLRYATAIVGAALAPVLLAFVFDVGVSGIDESSVRYLVGVFWVALGHALILGLPTAILLLETGSASVLAAALAGFLIGAIPMGVYLGFAILTSGTGWSDFAGLVGTSGLYGAGAGLAAWVIWCVTARVAGLVLLGIGVVAGSIVVLRAPGDFVDRSCHNPSTYGLQSIDWEITGELPIGPEESRDLTALFERFAFALGWSFRNSSTNEPIQSLYLSICSTEGTWVTAMRQIWPNAPAFMQDRGVSITVHQPLGGDAWEVPARQLLQAIEEQWPGEMVFTGERGQPVAPPAYLGRDATAMPSP